MRRIITALLLTFTAAGAFADCNPDVDPASCTVEQAFTFYSTAAVKTAATNAAVNEVQTANRAIVPPDTFASDVHNSYQDFLNRLGFAINKIEESEDGQALIIRFNPINSGSYVLGGTLTAAKPGVSDLVKNKLPETGREDLLRQMEGQLGQLDNLTYSVSGALQTAKCTVDRDPADRCWGRDPETYRDFLSLGAEKMLAASAGEMPFELNEELAALRRDPANHNLFGMNLKNDFTNADRAREIIKERAEGEAEITIAEKKMFTAAGLQNLASLVDNQPQFTSSVNYHDAGRYGGPPVVSASFELQFGNGNINALRSQCGRGDVSCFQRELATRLQSPVMSTMKYVLSGSFAMNDDYKLSDLGEGVPVPDKFAIDEKSSRVITLKAQAGSQMPTSVGDKRMRADGSLEFERVTTGDVSRRKNRLVGKATLTVPLGDSMSIPLSITWANKEKYLGDQTDKFGMHLGISYRIPDLFKPKK